MPERIPKWSVAYGIKGLHEIHRRDPHFDTPLLALVLGDLQSRQVVKRLEWSPEPTLVFWLHTIEFRAQPMAQKRRTELVRRWQSAYWHGVSCLFHTSRFVNHFYANSSPSRWCAILVFQYLIENLSRHFFRLFTTRFDVFRAYSIAVARLTFFSRLLIAACTSFLRTPESHLSCPRPLVFSIICSFHLCSDHSPLSSLSLRRASCCGTLRRRWQFLSEMSPFLLFHSSFWG